ncbi:glycogen debranching protein GlgX [Mesorhizobium sp. KR9-304]|uniref:glycogen debranching protein GlgX n=1 Tax=Mesorhizobium sp. KR9-304 TaxID=3156614 RepID=UPI0032B4A33C
MQVGRAAAIKPRLGAHVSPDGIRFAIWSGAAPRMWVSTFDARGSRETDRIELSRGADGVFSAFVHGLKEGARYGLRADGEYAPERGLWFDPDKLLADPYAIEMDRQYVFDARLSARRGEGGDTAPLMPKAIARALPEPVSPRPPLFRPGGLIYELNVRAFTMLHPAIPKRMRGTVAALRHPAVLAHLQKLGIAAVELMPVTAWIDERHLSALGLRNSWGYNPVTFMALDPRLAPGGLLELRDTVAALREAGIGTILDLVFNHTGESDVFGPTLSLRGLDARTYYRHRDDGSLVNDTGTGNTIDCSQPVVQELILDSLRHFVRHAGVDGFRFDLATILGREPQGFDTQAPLLAAMGSDPVLADRIMIAEPWDIGPGGYQLGNFPQNFLEWNDRYRDDIRRFWRGDDDTIGTLATRLAGSSDIFASGGAKETRTVNFVAAHDGMTLADMSAYEKKHNEANGENNRDGHDENFSWNCGTEGESANPKVKVQRAHDTCALLATLFMSRGTIMLTAGDEFGRTQKGNNNAYAQDNALTWLDWAGRDQSIEEFTIALAAIRKAAPALANMALLTGEAAGGVADVAWLDETGRPLGTEQWTDPRRRRFSMVLANGTPDGGRLAVMLNGDREGVSFVLPLRDEFRWKRLLPEGRGSGDWTIAGRTVALAIEEAAAGGKGGR